MKCKTPEEVLAYDQGVRDERERIADVLSKSVAVGGIPYALVEWDEEDERLGREAMISQEILVALEPA